MRAALAFLLGLAVGYLLRRRAMPYAPGFVQRNAEPTEYIDYVDWARYDAWNKGVTTWS